ncbi:MAG: glycosyltransferase family 2 protein [Rhodocyclaceae bacterium]|nr:glycosyltransferase family 2 protein [Rhodocyclaceae bacterium]
MNRDLSASCVAILLGSYNGARHLQEQLDSIAEQSHPDWRLIASDDGSTDATRELLERFRDRRPGGHVVVRSGPGKGFLANFLGMACDPGVQAPYYAFCDQDDVWEADKLARAIDRLRTVPAGVPAVYCTRTHLIGEHGEPLGYSPLFRRAPCFRNALVQSIAGGNTMVFNEAARALVATAGAQARVASHDWWVYLLVSGAGGTVFYDSWPSVRYRQHGSNLVGGNVGSKARLRRFVKLLEGRFRSWNAMHCRALQEVEFLLTPENQEIFRIFTHSRSAGVARRLGGVLQARVFRQTPIGNLGLYASVLINRF